LNVARPGSAGERRRTPSLTSPLRLDLLANPFGASLRVPEALASIDDLHLPQPERAVRLRRCLAGLHSVPDNRIVLGNGIDDLILAIVKLADGPVVLFPPTDDETARLAAWIGAEVVTVERATGFAVQLDPGAEALPRNGIAFVQSPNDPTGTILGAQDAVRIARRCRLLVVDERHGAYSLRTLLPYVREFDNVVILRTFETWAGLAGLPIAYAVAPPSIAAAIDSRRARSEVALGPVIAAQATLEDLPWMEATIDRVREEKSRLYRTLRKLNMIRPSPSWANFLLARIERGAIDQFETALNEREIRVHRPSHPGVQDCFRISAASGDATNALKMALIEAARDL
jgi:histidinol-phosphate aminotransferase